MGKKRRQRGANGLPWFRADRDCWCIPGDPKKSPIRDARGNPIRGKDNRDVALHAWHESQTVAYAGQAGVNNPVKTILEMYLQDAHGRLSEKTFGNYKSYFQSFTDCWPGLLVSNLKPFHVQQWWAKSHPNWGQSIRNLSGSALKAALRWAALPGKGGAIIPQSPLEGMELPTMRKRSAEVVITEEEFKQFLTAIQSEELRDIVQVAWETGTRPVNLRRVTAENLTDGAKALMLAEHNMPATSTVHKTFKKTGRPLVIPLPESVRGIVGRLAAERPTGPLFLTPRGLPWTDANLATQVNAAAKKVGLDGRLTAYSMRHTRTTDLLEAGMSPTDVAAIVGNTPGIIHRNYSHISANVDRLLKLRDEASKT